MRTVYQHLADAAHDDTRERAASVFLDLRDKLRSGFRRDVQAVHPVPVDDERVALTDGQEALLGAIETDIIPRLLLVHRGGRPDAVPQQRSGLEAEDRSSFLETVMTQSAASTRHFVDRLLERGMTHEVIFLDLLTWSARRLGELWEEDQCNFAEVTIGLCRLHQVLRELSLYECGDLRPASDAPRVLLATACGDQHVFGVVMVAEFFRRDGWRVWSEPGASRDQLARLLADEAFDLLGISAACTAVADEVGAEIGALRKASRNRDLKVMVGGRLFADTPELMNRIDADGSAFDASTAPSTGNELLSR